MLFNKSTGMPKPDVLSTASLIAWLEGKVAGYPSYYSYTDSRHCLLSQYFKDQGFTAVRVLPYCYNHGGLMSFLGWKTLPEGWEHVAKGSDGDENEWTFDKALQRAKVLEVMEDA
jgi:hypothetical protein